jgi:hypothetical protein
MEVVMGCLRTLVELGEKVTIVVEKYPALEILPRTNNYIGRWSFLKNV